MNLYELVPDKGAVLDAAFADVKLHPKKKPTAEFAMGVALSHAEKIGIANAAALIHDDVDEMYGMYTIMNGERSDHEGDQPALDDWDSGIDDQVETLMQPYQEYLSANWLGVNTIDTRLYEEDGVVKFCQSFGKELWKQLTHDRTPDQVLAGVGIVKADVADRIGAAVTSVAPPSKTDEVGTIDRVVLRLLAHVGREYDAQLITDDLDLVADGDENLAPAAAARLGLDEVDMNTVELYSLEHGTSTVKNIMAKLDDMRDNPPMPEAKPAQAAPAAEKVEGLEPVMLSIAKDAFGLNDTTLGVMLGASRQTTANWATGKTTFAPTAQQLGSFRDEAIKRINAGLKVLAMIDGDPQPLEVS